MLGFGGISKDYEPFQGVLGVLCHATSGGAGAVFPSCGISAGVGGCGGRVGAWTNHRSCRGVRLLFGSMKPIQSYVICTSPRSGSTLLCRLLQEAGGAGFPDSHFHEPSLEKWLGHYGFRKEQFSDPKEALTTVFHAALKYGKGKSTVFGLRLQRHSFDYFRQQLSVLHPSLPDDKSRINAAFGNTLFIHLTRQSKLDQAISYVRAKQSGLWHMAPDGTEIERLSEPKDPVYDAAAISSQLELLEQMETDWQTWFRAESIKPLCVTYDELSAAPYATLVRVLDALGLEHGGNAEIMPPTAKLADAINREWAERFRQEELR